METLKASVLEKRETVTKLRDEAGKWRIQVLTLLLSVLAVLVQQVQILSQKLRDQAGKWRIQVLSLLVGLLAVLVQKVQILTQKLQDEMLRAEEDMLLN